MRNFANGGVTADLAGGAVLRPVEMAEGAMVVGTYGVACYDARQLIADLDRKHDSVARRLVGRSWRRVFAGRPLAAALQLGVVSIEELRSLLSWRDVVQANLLVNTGRNEYLERLWKASGYTAQHYLGLIDGPTPTIAAGDTMASHAGWTEFTEYSEAVSTLRPNLTAALGSVASQALSTSTPLEYLINDDGLDVTGAFTSTAGAKGGATGTLITAGVFSQGNRSVNTGDTLAVDVTFTMASA